MSIQNNHHVLIPKKKRISLVVFMTTSYKIFVRKPFLILCFFTVFVIPTIGIDVFGHGGNPGFDRASPIDFENRNVTVEARMNPSDMTLGDFSNAFMKITFLNESTRQPFKQVLYAIDIYKNEELLARNNFYAENGTVTIDIRPNDVCADSVIWKCSKYYGTEHPIAGGLYTFGQNNPVIDGPIFVKGGLYHIKVSVLGADSVRSNLLNPLEFDLYVTIAQEYTFYIDVPKNLIT